MEPGVSFANYRFDVETGRLWSGGQEIRLTPKASGVLKEQCMPPSTNGTAREKTTWSGQNVPVTGRWSWHRAWPRPMWRGVALSLSARYDEAAQEFEEAIRLNPNLFDAYYYFARTSFARGEIAHSAELFRAAGDVRQEDFQSPTLQGQSLRMLGREEESQASTKEGICRAERILALNPLDVRALSLGSGALFHDGQRARAFEWSARSLELFPDDMGALIQAASLHAKARRKRKRWRCSSACSGAAGGSATGWSTIPTTTSCATTGDSRSFWPGSSDLGVRRVSDPRPALQFAEIFHPGHIPGIGRNSKTSIDAPGDMKCGWLFRRFIRASFDSAWRIE